MTLSIITFGITKNKCDIQHIDTQAAVLSVANKPFNLSVFLLNVDMLGVIMLKVVAPFKICVSGLRYTQLKHTKWCPL
jgi:hypothetical protein